MVSVMSILIIPDGIFDIFVVSERTGKPILLTVPCFMKYRIYLYLCIKHKQMDYFNLYTKINVLPNDLKSEVNNFIDFLLSKRKKEIKKKKPRFGCAKGLIYMAPDFDEPLDDFKEYMQ